MTFGGMGSYQMRDQISGLSSLGPFRPTCSGGLALTEETTEITVSVREGVAVAVVAVPM